MMLATDGSELLRRCEPGQEAQVELSLVREEKELAMLEDLMTVRDPDRLSIGFDVKQKEPPHVGVQMRAAWKVHGKLLDDYHVAVREQNAGKAPGKEYWVPTYKHDLQKRLRAEKFLDDNECLLLKGVNLRHLSPVLAHGFSYEHVRKDSTFGNGLYLADVIDKANQYSTSYVDAEDATLKGWDFATKIGLGEDVGPVDIGENADVFYVLVVRAYLGRHLEVQKEGSLPPVDGKKHNKWHWRDPKGTDVVLDDYDNTLDKRPPSEFGEDWDSVKVMATEIDKDFSESWIQMKEGPGGKLQDNTVPRRFNEYILRQRSQGGPDISAATQYVVAYTRVVKPKD